MEKEERLSICWQHMTTFRAPCFDTNVNLSSLFLFLLLERESQRRLNAKSYFFRTAQNDFSARFRIGQKYAQPESALKPILDLFFFPRGVVFSQSPAKSLFFSV